MGCNDPSIPFQFLSRTYLIQGVLKINEGIFYPVKKVLARPKAYVKIVIAPSHVFIFEISM